ncbi:MAG: hypothetical protein NT178_13845 [Proteobacteria bacterium]|nr:hypothetical protein [Pseudomonadota bacterium]
MIAAQNKKDAKRREQIISEYGSYLENHPWNGGEIRDVSNLPYPKKDILEAITSEMVQESNSQRVEVMKACAMMLADFQENVGPKPLTMFGLSSTDILSMLSAVKKDEGVLDGTIDRLKEIATNQNKEKYDSFRKIADEELEHIKKKLMVAEELRKQIPEETKN